MVINKDKFDGISAEKYKSVVNIAEDVRKRIPDLRFTGTDASTTAAELTLACDLVIWAAKKQLGEDVCNKSTAAEFARVWLLRNRPGGLGDSARRIRDA